MSLPGFFGRAGNCPGAAWGLPADAFRWRSEKVQLKAQQCAPQDIQAAI